MKPRVDTSCPQRRPHLGNSGRKKRIVSERNTEIQHHNKMLLGKMLKIDIGQSMRTPAQAANFNKTEVLQLKSLHGPYRYAQLTKITKDNLSMLSRIRKTNSNYSNDAWRKERSYNTYMAKNISENSGRVSSSAHRRSDSYKDQLGHSVLSRTAESNRPTTSPMDVTLSGIQPVIEENEERPGSAGEAEN